MELFVIGMVSSSECPSLFGNLTISSKNFWSESAMSIFNFSEEQSLGEVRSVETSRITVRVTDGQRLQKARVGRLVAIQSVGDEWLIELSKEFGDIQ